MSRPVNDKIKDAINVQYNTTRQGVDEIRDAYNSDDSKECSKHLKESKKHLNDVAEKIDEITKVLDNEG